MVIFSLYRLLRTTASHQEIKMFTINIKIIPLKLLFLRNYLKLEIDFSISTLSQHNENCSTSHLD